MKVIDATKNPARAACRAWRRRLQGAITRTIASPTPAATWKAAVPALNAAADAMIRVMLEHEFHRHGRTPRAATCEQVRAGRADAERFVALVMGPKRCVQILCEVGVDLERAVRLVKLAGASVSEALAFADVITLMPLDDEERGAA